MRSLIETCGMTADTPMTATLRIDPTPGRTADRIEWCVSVPGVPAMVGILRRLVRTLLAGAPRIDDIELVTSELVTNAIRHTPCGDAGATVTLRIVAVAPWTRVEVTDLGAGAWPEIAPPAEDEEYGRGLVIVDALADDTGRMAVPAGRLSWAELDDTP